HVSIGFDNDLTEVYSFGRKRPKNPFIGGFVKEDIRSDFLRESECAIYAYQLTKTEREVILSNIKTMEADNNNYKYTFIGLFGVFLQIKINRKQAYFCSQFVATVLNGTNCFKLSKPDYFITPSDIRNHAGLRLVYQGKLADYCDRVVPKDRKPMD